MIDEEIYDNPTLLIIEGYKFASAWLFQIISLINENLQL